MGTIRSSTTRAFAGGLLALTVAGAVTAQERTEPTNQLHYPVSDELAGLLKAGDAARAEGRLAEAVDAYRTVLDGDHLPSSGYQVVPRDLQAKGGPAYRRFVGATEWAMEGLHALPPEGKKLFRDRFDYRAASARTAAVKAPDPYRALAVVYERFPVSSHAAPILEAMGDLALERGELARAARAFSRLLANHQGELQSPPRVRQKLLLCAVGLGQPARVKELLAALRKDDPEGKVHLGGAPLDPEKIVEQAVVVESTRLGRSGKRGPQAPLIRVDPANRAAVEAKPQAGPPRFAPRSFPTPLGAGRFAGGPGQLVPALHLPVVQDQTAFLVTADQVVAYDLMTGEEKPRIPRLGNLFTDPSRTKVIHGGAIEQDTLAVSLVDDVLRDQHYRGIPIKVRIPLCKLAGFDLGQWRWSWSHARSLDGTPQERWSFPAPPVASEGVLFAPAYSIEGFINCYASAFDARTGDPLWSTWLVSGQVEQTMFGEQALEPFVTPMALHDGIVYHSTSFGCVAALDADTGRPRWVTEYEQVEVRAPRGYYAEYRSIEWEANPPVVEDGVVVVAPLDSQKFYGFDALTGERVWESRRRPQATAGDMRYLFGACKVDGQGALVVAGGNEVRAYAMKGGKLLWNVQLRGRAVAGRGCIAGGTAIVPVDRNEAYLFDVATGKRLGSVELGATGNLLVLGDHIIITGNGTFAVHRNSTGGAQGGQDF